MAEGSDTRAEDIPISKPNALTSLSYVETPEGRTLAYQHLEGNTPGVVYIHGLNGSMNDPPAQALRDYCKEKDVSLLCFDLSGHGNSSGSFKDCTFTKWLEDIEAILNILTSGPLVLVGSTMGAWLMFLYTMRNPDRVFGLVGMGIAADFTHLLWKRLDKSTKDEVKRTGFYSLEHPTGTVMLSLDLIMDGEKHTILDMPGIEIIKSPTWLIHGDQDANTPPSIPLQLMQKLQCPVELKMIENGTHWLYRSEDLQHMILAIDCLLYPTSNNPGGGEEREDDD